MKKNSMPDGRDKAVSMIAVSVFLSVMALIMCFTGCPSSPISCATLPDPQETISRYFELLSKGRYGECDPYLLDFSLSEMDQQSGSESAAKMRTLLNSSYSCTLNDESDISGMTAYQSVTITYLDLPTFGAAVKEQANKLAEELNFQGVDIFTEEAALEIAGQALDAMESDIRLYCVSEDIVMELNYVDDCWKIVFQPELERMIMGNSIDQ